MGVQTGLIAFVADLLSVNRKLLEEQRVERMRDKYNKERA
jgi:hypothetical protein